MSSDLISRLENNLTLLKTVEERDQVQLDNSNEPIVDKIFLNSTIKMRKKIEKELHLAKTERAHELVKLRFFGTQMDGSIKLKTLVGIIEPLNTMLEYSSWRFWDKKGTTDRIDEHFANILDLRLASIESGSTQLNIVGNTSPDLTGTSALEEGLRSVFRLLASKNDTFADHIHDVGMPGCKSMARLMDYLEKRNIAVDMKWGGPDSIYEWNGRPEEITRVKAFLDDIGDPIVESERFKGVVQVLSIRNKVELFRLDLNCKVIVNYHHSLQDQVHSLHLGETRYFEVEKTSYPIRGARQKKDAYTLKEVITG